MSTAIATITDDIYALRNSFQSVAVDRGMNFDKEAGFAIQLLSGNEYALKAAMANRQSVADAVTNVAAIGISLNPAKKQAYLVPRKNKICLDISYIGLLDLAIATGSILWGQAKVVREHDAFVLNNLDELPTHKYKPFDGPAKRGAIVGAYVVVKTPDGEYLTHTMDIAQIYGIRDRSESWKASQSGPWKSDEEEMIKKTVVKQAYKYWPKTDRTERVDEAIQYMNTEGGEGFDPLRPDGGGQFPVNVLNEWIEKANAATTAEALALIWQQGLAEIKPSKDMGAYNAFKAAVVERGDAIKKNAPTDVTDKRAAPASDAAGGGDSKPPGGKPAATNADDPRPTYAKVADLMAKAKTMAALEIAADWIKDLPDEEHRNELNAKYETYKAKLKK